MFEWKLAMFSFVVESTRRENCPGKNVPISRDDCRPIHDGMFLEMLGLL
jgi:hypothetical protein